MKDRIVLIEFNELCPPLLDNWMASGELPNFSKFYGNSHTFITTPCVSEQENLEPWIQWYSLHTGLAYDQHKVFHLADGPDAPYPDIWSVLAKSDIPVGNCGSMNARGFQFPGSYFLPDPWCTTESAFPQNLQHYYDFVSFFVREYSNDNAKLRMSTYLNFIKFMISHGLKLDTISTITTQLLLERIVDKRQSWKRVSILDQIQYDVFAYYQKHLRPRFSTYFVNSTAHLQHAYWRNMEPEKFPVKPSQEDQDVYGNAVLYGYKKMDTLLGRFMNSVSDDTMLILATALSQQPFLKGEKTGGQRFYRPKNIRQMLDGIGIEYTDVQPVMTHQFQVRFENSENLQTAKSILEIITCDGKKVFNANLAKDNSIYVDCPFHHIVDQDSELIIGNGEKSVRFYDVLYLIDATKSGFHHPDGVLWIRCGKHQRHEDTVSVLDIFPTVLDFFDVGLPSNGHSYRGKSLMPILQNSRTMKAA